MPYPRDVLLAAVRDCVTIIEPGQVLVVRLATGKPASAYADMAMKLTEVSAATGIPIALVIADELAVAEVAPEVNPDVIHAWPLEGTLEMPCCGTDRTASHQVTRDAAMVTCGGLNLAGEFILATTRGETE